MAITFNLPTSDWYFDTTSQWTLDYPPLFAAFELLLALIAHLLHIDDALVLSESPIRNQSIIVYQKLTVISSDIVYYYSVYALCKALKPLVKDSSNKKHSSQPFAATTNDKTEVSSDQSIPDALYRPDAISCISLLLLFQPGLLLVDHIHFQYNGLLSGFLLLSMANIIEGRFVTGAFWFTTLLNFKHIYLYCAPAFGTYLLASHCLAKDDNRNRLISFLTRIFKLGLIVILVFIITYLPFRHLGTLQQIAKRLFPFKRGLTHAYWAPNAWSLYNLADKILATVFKDSLKVTFDMESISKTRPVSSTSGIVQEYEHQYLPTVKPLTTFSLVGATMIPIIMKLLLNTNKRSPRLFMKGVVLTAFTSFMFGWHVHEKAIILVLLALVPISCTDVNLRSTFLRLTLAGTYSLFPLIHQPAEHLTKLSLLLTYSSYARGQFASGHQKAAPGIQSGRVKKFVAKLYLLLDRVFVVVLILNELYVTLIHGRLNYSWNPLARLNKYEFLPLMSTSCLTAIGIAYSYFELYYDFVLGSEEP